MDKLINVREKVVVITGASSGAGRSIALAFAEQGSKVVLAARNESALADVAAECESLGAEVMVIPTDVTDTGAMINLANKAKSWKGILDVWINNAGILAAGPFDATPMAVHKQAIETNLIGYMNGVHAVLPIFKSQGYGTIINNISIGGYLPLPYGAGYSASKFGLRGFSESIKGELSAWPNIYICDLFPAFLDTPGVLHAGNYTGKKLVPAPPVYDPQQLAKAVLQVAAHPQSTKYVGGISLLAKFAHSLLPETIVKITGMFMRRYFKAAVDMPLTDGNLFTTVNYAMSTHGGFDRPPYKLKSGKYIGAALIAGLAAGWYFTYASKRIN